MKEIEDTHDLFGKDKFRWMLYRIGRSFWEIGQISRIEIDGCPNNPLCPIVDLTNAHTE